MSGAPQWPKINKPASWVFWRKYPLTSMDTKWRILFFNGSIIFPNRAWNTTKPSTNCSLRLPRKRLWCTVSWAQLHGLHFHRLCRPTHVFVWISVAAFTCSLQKEVLYHGKLYVSENYLCFHSSVLLKDTKVNGYRGSVTHMNTPFHVKSVPNVLSKVVIPASSVTLVKKLYLSMVSVRTADEEKVRINTHIQAWFVSHF